MKKNIKGIWIKGTESEHKVFQYADDTTLIVKDIKSIDKAMEWKFSKNNVKEQGQRLIQKKQHT